MAQLAASDHLAAGGAAGVEGLSALDRLTEEARTLRVAVVLGLSPSKKFSAENEVRTLHPPILNIRGCTFSSRVRNRLNSGDGRRFTDRIPRVVLRLMTE